MEPRRSVRPESGTDAVTKFRKICGLDTLVLLGCAGLFVCLRARWIGHLLVWDEAMTLSSVRSMLAGGQDHFTNWFWRHPPGFALLMMLLAPLRAGFAERVQWLAVGIGVLNLCLLFELNRKTLGCTAARWSVFLLAVLPGAVFFDVWIKRDPLVTTFGLLALLLLRQRRVIYAAVSLGLALLSKETAVFYLGAALLCVLLESRGRTRWRELLALALIPVCMSGWWYWLAPQAMVDNFGRSAGIDWTHHLRFALTAAGVWRQDGAYYIRLLGLLLGAGPLLLSAAGAFVVAVRFFRRGQAMTLWPALLVVPSLVLLTLLPAKVPWIVIVLLPGLATLAAVGLAVGVRRLRVAGLPHSIRCLLVMQVVAVLLLPALQQQYDVFLRQVTPDQWRGARYSRTAALTLREVLRPEDRVLLTSFHYWQGIPPGQACPVFAHYFENAAPVLLRSHLRPYSALLDDIRQYRLDWALLSPDPQHGMPGILDGFFNDAKLQPKMLERAFLFETRTLYAVVDSE